MPVPSIRAIMVSAHRPVAEQLEFVGRTNATYEDLRAGRDVVLTPATLRYTTDHPAYPPDLDAFAEWLLTGDNTLTGVA